jgi:uncharacterized protein YdhG (YjbR/CyaY superfamily)
MANSNFKDIDQYISTFPEATQKKLVEMRQIIKSAAPEASEKISYQIPTLTLHGNLVHFAGFEHHIGFYPAPSSITKFENELKEYKQAKGSVQFPLNQPLPKELIAKMVEFRVKENSKL